MENPISKKRNRDDSAELTTVSETGSPEVKRLRDDLLGFFDESDPEPTTQDLDSLMRSFEEEIATSSSPVPVVDLTADSGESQPELGFLLGASDDELGLPPSGTEFARVSSDLCGIGEMWRYEDLIPNYDAFELEAGDVVYSGGGGGGGTAEYVGFDGLFEYSNLCFDGSENSDFLWRQDQPLPAQ